MKHTLLHYLSRNYQEDSDKTLGACSMAYSTEAGPTKYLVGTEQGVVVSVNTRVRGANNGVSFFSQVFMLTGEIYAILILSTTMPAT